MAKAKPKPVQRELKPNSIMVEVLCGCTHKPYPHSHKNDIGDVPWNWEKTHKIWAEQEAKRKEHRPRVIVANGKMERV
jgi:hypothetical protein